MIAWDRVRSLREEVGRDDFAEVVEMFLSEVDEVILRLRNTPDPDRLEAELHFLKSSALNLGFSGFAELCSQGERQAAAGHPVDLAPVFGCLTRSRQAFEQGLATL